METSLKSKAKRPSTGKRKTSIQSSQMISEEIVRQRAYELYLSRDIHFGSPEDDWYAAERQISLEY